MNEAQKGGRGLHNTVFATRYLAGENRPGE